MIEHLRQIWSDFAGSRKGAVAVMAAIMMVPLVGAAGIATDYSREAMLKASLQSIADDAALAGASMLNLSSSDTEAISVATNYFNKGFATLAGGAATPTLSVSAPNSTTVVVTATTTLKSTLMGYFKVLSLPIGVSATAQGPGYAIKVQKIGGFDSGAADGNTIYYYIVPAGGGIPLNLSAYTELFTNDPAVDPNFAVDNNVPKTIVAGPTQQIGFAMLNHTGSVNPFYYNGGSNQYGGTQGTYHYFFSSLPVPTNYPGLGYTNQGTFYTGTIASDGSCKNKTAITGTVTNFVANSGWTNHCSAHPCTTLTNAANGTPTVYNNNLLINGSCSNPASGAPTCQQLYSGPEEYRWNDMGGIYAGVGDDNYDYTDADYTVNCVPNTLPTSSSGPAQVILTQ